jgi:16S rRNA (guanine527-N7)-methyltransferase
LALARPDLSVTLLEPVLRRTRFLIEVVDRLALTSVSVVRGRAEDRLGVLRADVVVARAVASLDRLAVWCLPLVRPGGRLLAMKGASAAVEIDRSAANVAAIGGGPARVRVCGKGVVEPPTTVVEILRRSAPDRKR